MKVQSVAFHTAAACTVFRHNNSFWLSIQNILLPQQ